MCVLEEAECTLPLSSRASGTRRSPANSALSGCQREVEAQKEAASVYEQQFIAKEMLKGFVCPFTCFSLERSYSSSYSICTVPTSLHVSLDPAALSPSPPPTVLLSLYISILHSSLHVAMCSSLIRWDLNSRSFSGLTEVVKHLRKFQAAASPWSKKRQHFLGVFKAQMETLHVTSQICNPLVLWNISYPLQDVKYNFQDRKSWKLKSMIHLKGDWLNSACVGNSWHATLNSILLIVTILAYMCLILECVGKYLLYWHSKCYFIT